MNRGKRVVTTLLLVTNLCLFSVPSYAKSGLNINFHRSSQHSRALYHHYLSYEPKEIIDYLESTSVEINVSPNGLYTEGHAGMYYTDREVERTINVNCSTDKKLRMAVNHEIGHYLDEMIGVKWDSYLFSSEFPEFMEIYVAEAKNSGYPSWTIGDSVEFFAETYRYIVEGNQDMLKNVPRAYAYVRTVINETYGTHL